MKKATKETSMRNWIVGVLTFILLAFALPMIRQDMQDSIHPSGHETTYHFGPAVFVNVDITVGRDDKMELVQITRYGWTKSYLLAEIKGRLLAKTVEHDDNGQTALYWDDYQKVDPFDRALIDEARAKVTQKRSKNSVA